MIRAVALVSLVTLLVLVLYVPAVNPPERFVRQLRSEHDAVVGYWGPQRAYAMLERAMQMQSEAGQMSPLPAVRNAQRTPDADASVDAQMTSMQQRLFNNAYFRSVDALLALASYRLTGLLEWLPWLLPLIVVAAIDGALVRVIRAKEFLQHDPELFAVWASLIVITSCATVVALVLPVDMHPAALAAAPLTIAFLVARVIAHFHRRA